MVDRRTVAVKAAVARSSDVDKACEAEQLQGVVVAEPRSLAAARSENQKF